MKKKNIQAFKDEQKRIANAQVELLEKIKQNWFALKSSISSKQIANIQPENVAQIHSGIYNQSIFLKKLQLYIGFVGRKTGNKGQ